MNKLILFAAIVFVSPFFTGCNKNDNPPKSDTDYIIQGSWKFDKATSNGSDVSGVIQACYKDNVLTFTANGNGTLDEGASKCNSGDPQSTNFTWNFTNNGSTLNVSSGIIVGQAGSFKILSLNDSQMALEATISGVTGQVYFKH